MAYRTMADGIGGTARDPQAIRDEFGPGVLAAGYVDGAWAWTQAQWGLFNHHVYVSAVAGSAEAMQADVADCENGDYDPVQAAAWVHAKKRAGYDRPTIYCNLSNADAVRQATGTLVLERDYDIWLAWYDGRPVPYVFPDSRKAAAKQYESTSLYDKSAVFDPGWPHRTAAVPAKQWHEWDTAGDLSLAAFAAKVNTGPATLLSDTAVHYGYFDGTLGNYVKGVFEGTVKPTDPMPKGCRFWVHA